MFDAEIESLLDMSESELISRLTASSERFYLRIDDQLYEASSKSELADGWLRIWYVGERLAEYADRANVYFRQESDDGGAAVTFTFHRVQPEPMAAALLDLACGFDGDDLEGQLYIMDSVRSWLESRRNAIVKFPELEESFRVDAEEARESEGYGIETDDEGG